MLANLLKFCPTGEEYTAFFSEAFTQTLPADLQILLDGSEDGVLKQFPQKADKLWAICCPADATMAVVGLVEGKNSCGKIREAAVA